MSLRQLATWAVLSLLGIAGVLGVLSLSDRASQASEATWSALGDGATEDRLMPEARAMHRGAPLSVDPFLQFATLSEDETRFDALSSHARRLNRRSDRNAILRLERDIAAGRLRDAVREVELLARIDPDNYATYIEDLGVFGALPATREIVFEAMEACPGWIRNFVSNNIVLLGEAPRPQILRGIEIQSRVCDDPKLTRQLLRDYLERLAGLGRYGDAAVVMDRAASILGLPEPEGLIRNDAFQGEAALPPFDWSFSDTARASADYDRGRGGAFATYRGTDRETLLSQIIVLPTTGRLRFEYRGRHRHDPRSGGFTWRLECLPLGRALMNVPLGNELQPETPVIEIFAAGGESCRFARLSFEGRPGELMRRISADLTSVSLAVEATVR
ncbi:MAG: hypothetical protein WBG08_03635 [Litorimonas sp.]